MLKLSVSTEQLRISEYLERLGWVRNMHGDYYSVGLHADWDLEFRGGWWYLGKFTDSDINGVAVGRYQTVEEGETLAELRDALYDAGALEEGRYGVIEPKATILPELGIFALFCLVFWAVMHYVRT